MYLASACRMIFFLSRSVSQLPLSLQVYSAPVQTQWVEDLGNQKAVVPVDGAKSGSVNGTQPTFHSKSMLIAQGTV
jgi:hypothetical protein